MADIRGQNEQGPGAPSACHLTSVLWELLRMAGFTRQHSGMNAEFLQRTIVFSTDVGAENKISIGAAVQPAIILNLGLELPGRPARIAERPQSAPRAVAFRDRLEDVKRRGEADAVIDRQGRILDEIIA